MNSSGKTLTILLGGIMIVALLASLLLSGVAATFAWMADGGYGSGPPLCQMVTPATTPFTPAITPPPGVNTSACVKASQIGAQVVALARAMAAALYVNPACGGASAIQTATTPGIRRQEAPIHLACPPSRRR